MTENEDKPTLTIIFESPGSALFQVTHNPKHQIYAEQLLTIASKLEFLGKQALQQQAITEMMREQEKQNKGKILTPQFTDIKQ